MPPCFLGSVCPATRDSNAAFGGTARKETKDKETIIKVPYKVTVTARKRPLDNGQFRTDIEPNRVLDLDDIARGRSQGSSRARSDASRLCLTNCRPRARIFSSSPRAAAVTSRSSPSGAAPKSASDRCGRFSDRIYKINRIKKGRHEIG